MTDKKEIRKIGVLGCGLMGSGIAQVAASNGYEVVVMEINEEVLNKGLGRITKNLDRMVSKGRLSDAGKDEIMGRLSGTRQLADLAGSDMVIEAVVENLDIKQDIWRKLDQLCPSNTIFASNTSSLKISLQAEATSRGDRFVGLHFFNPVPMMKLVEVIRTDETSDETHAAAMDFSRALGKDPITCVDSTGFVVNRLLTPYLLDAVRALERGIASVEDIDKAMRLGCGHPMGPLALMDFIGLDTVLYISNIMLEEFGEPSCAPPKLLSEMVSQGKLGKKSGQGFYSY